MFSWAVSFLLFFFFFFFLCVFSCCKETGIQLSVSSLLECFFVSLCWNEKS
jgi:hypothetical protein